jgi:hypothetical protein
MWELVALDQRGVTEGRLPTPKFTAKYRSMSVIVSAVCEDSLFNVECSVRYAMSNEECT